MPLTDICRYRDPDTGEPMCIVGRVVARAMPDAVFAEGGGIYSNTTIMNAYDVDSVVFLSHLQSWQDHNATWGAAYLMAGDKHDYYDSADTEDE